MQIYIKKTKNLEMLHPLSESQLKLKDLSEVINCDPMIRGCISTLRSNCLKSELDCTEGDKPLKAGLKRVICDHYAQFLNDAFDLIFACGFVPIYFKTIDNVKLPFTLPLGTFTWFVETTNEDSQTLDSMQKHEICSYRVKFTTSFKNLDEKNIYIYPYSRPNITSKVCDSPIQQLVQMHIALQNFINQDQRVREWNLQKHLVMSESVNLSDQTTSGIQLLDEVRRYQLTGKHSMMLPNAVTRLRNKDNNPFQTVNDAQIHHLKETFNEYGHPYDSNHQKDATTHLAPPNMQVHELNQLQIDSSTQTYLSLYQTQVQSFFHKKLGSFVSSQNNTSDSEQMTKDEHSFIISVCKFLERLCECTYARAFGCKSSDVKFSLQVGSRLSINSTNDIKTLSDSFSGENIGRFLGEPERKKMKQMISFD